MRSVRGGAARATAVARRAPPTYGPAVTTEAFPPSLGAALRLALRALGREGWLVAAGIGVSLARRVLMVPAWAVLWALAAEAAWIAARGHPLDPLAPVAGVLAAVTSPRALALVAALWLAGVLLGAALRVAWLAGALPVLGTAMAGGEGGPPVFAEGVTFRLPRVLAAAFLGLVLDATGAGWALALVLGVARLVGTPAGRAAPFLAAACALALVLALAVPIALGVLADAAVARAALRDEPPGEAYAGATRRFLARPGTFVLATLLFAATGLAGAIAVATIRQAALGFAHAASPAVMLGPGLMLSLLAVAVAAAVDVAWLGTVSALACGAAGAPAPPTS